jgi:hypothetical protein
VVNLYSKDVRSGRKIVAQVIQEVGLQEMIDGAADGVDGLQARE